MVQSSARHLKPNYKESTATNSRFEAPLNVSDLLLCCQIKLRGSGRNRHLDCPVSSFKPSHSLFNLLSGFIKLENNKKMKSFALMSVHICAWHVTYIFVQERVLSRRNADVSLLYRRDIPVVLQDVLCSSANRFLLDSEPQFTIVLELSQIMDELNGLVDALRRKDCRRRGRFFD